MNAHEAAFALDDLTKTKTVREVMEEAMIIAVTHAAGRVMNGCYPEIVDEQDLGRYHHFHLMIAGEHSETDAQWREKVVKSDFMTKARIEIFHNRLAEKLSERSFKLNSLSMVFFFEHRRFGFSIILDKVTV